MREGRINNNEGGPKRDSVTLKSCWRVTSHIFVKEPEGSSEKILTNVKCTYAKNYYVFNISLSYEIFLRLLTIALTAKMVSHYLRSSKIVEIWFGFTPHSSWLNCAPVKNCPVLLCFSCIITKKYLLDSCAFRQFSFLFIHIAKDEFSTYFNV